MEETQLAELSRGGIVLFGRPQSREMSFHISQLPDVEKLLGFSLHLPKRNPVVYDAGFVTKPYDHQVKVATHCVQFNRSAILSGMGTGKTKSAIDVCRYRLKHRQATHVLVVCPKHLLDTWRGQIAMHGKMKAVPLYGSSIDKLRKARSYRSSCNWFIINYESLKKTGERLLEFLSYAGPSPILILDEPTKIKTPTAQRTNATIWFANRVRYAIILSGDLTPNSLLDIYCPWFVVDRGQAFGRPSNRDKIAQGYYRFRARFFIKGFKGWKWKERKDTRRYVQGVMRHRGIRFTLDECMDMPPTQDIKITLPLSAPMKKHYQDMTKKLIVEVEQEGVVTVTNALAKVAKLQQICSGFIYAPREDGTNTLNELVPSKDMPKIDAMLDIIGEAEGKKCIVWCYYDYDAKVIMAALRQAKIMHRAILASSSPDATAEAEATFIKNPACRVLVSKPAIIGHGFNLNAATVNIYYSRDWKAEDYGQSRDRTMRLGQTKKVLYYHLIHSGTVDATIFKVVTKKVVLSRALMNFKRAIEGYEEEELE